MATGSAFKPVMATDGAFKPVMATDGAFKGKTVAIVGSGLIGRSFAMLFAASGYTVKMYDIEPHQTESALKDIHDQLLNLEKTGFLRGSLSVSEQESLITGVSDLASCVKDAFFVHECVFEKLELKRDVHSKIDALIGDNVVVASSASALLPSLISEKLKHRNRFIVVHPTNPPFYVPLIELVPAPWTESDVLDNTKTLMTEIGQVPVVVKKETDGFVLNRIQYAILAECWNLIEDEVMSVEDIDKVMSEGMGRRYAFMGPFETAYLNADGMYDYARKSKVTMDRILPSFRIPEHVMEGDILTIIHDDLSNRIPLSKLQERRQWRDTRLSALDKLKRDMDSKQF